MHTAARKLLETYLNEKKILTIEELGLKSSPDNSTKHMSFVTLYKDGKVIASSGRVHVKKENTLLEFIENTLFCLKDPRFTEAVKNPLELRNIKIRVDIIRPDQRRIIKNLNELNMRSEGLILISQNLGKLGVLLPNMTNIASKPEEYFSIVCKKAGVDEKSLKEEDYILYAIESIISTDF